jgi:hypothetical protein
MLALGLPCRTYSFQLVGSTLTRIEYPATSMVVMLNLHIPPAPVQDYISQHALSYPYPCLQYHLFPTAPRVPGWNMYCIKLCPHHSIPDTVHVHVHLILVPVRSTGGNTPA